MRQTTLLSWAFVEDIDWIESSHHPYGTGSTQEPRMALIGWKGIGSRKNLWWFWFC